MSSPVAVITGASGGVGKPLVHLLLERGWKIYAQYQNNRPQTANPRLHWWHADFSSPDTLSTAPPIAEPRVKALIHTAGVATLGTTADTTQQTWLETMNINLIAPTQLTRTLLPKLRAATGHVIYVNSGAGLTSHAQWGSYAASKFAARAWCDALREEEPSIRVSSIYPGRIDTGMQRKVVAQQGGTYKPDQYLTPLTVAQSIVSILQTPADAQIPDVTIRPRN